MKLKQFNRKEIKRLEIIDCPECGARFRAFRGVRSEKQNRLYIGKRRFVYFKFLKFCKCGKYPHFFKSVYDDK